MAIYITYVFDMEGSIDLVALDKTSFIFVKVNYLMDH